MPDVLDMLAGAYDEKPALVQGEEAWSYADLNRRANALARGILALGVSPGDRVIWVSPNHHMVTTFGHATRKAQLISVPLNYRFSPEEMAYVIADSDAVLVFCDPAYRATLEGLRDRTPNARHVLDFTAAEQLIAEHATDPLESETEGLGSSMIYTSGTTGKPKGALRRGVDPNLVAALVGELRLAPEDVHITTGPLYHSGPAAFAALTHLLGGTIVILPRFDVEQWLDLVQTHRITTTFTAPTQMKRLVSAPAELRAAYDTSSLRVVVANAAPVPYALKQQWVDAFGEDNLFEVYGSTELGVDTILKPEDQLSRPGSCGKPYGGIEIRLLSEDGGEAKTGEPGVMWIKTPGAFDEYYKAPEKTEGTKLSDDPSWRTVGDIAYRDEDGYFYICDRQTDMIISGGMNVYPAEVEAVLHAHPAVMDVAVFGVPSEEWGEQVHAVVQLKDGEAATEEELLGLASERLAGYKRPRSLEFRESLPRTESGKLLKRVLRDEHWKGRDSKV